MQVKFSDLIRNYDGSTDLSHWLDKVKMIARKQKVTDLADVLPMFLEGHAFAVFKKLSLKDQDNAGKIEAALVKAFSLNKYQAYDQFRQRVWQEGESVDVYLVDLQRLAGLADIDIPKVVEVAFVVGLPHDVASQVKAGSSAGKMNFTAIVELSRCYHVHV